MVRKESCVFKFLIGFALGFIVSSYGVQNSINKAEEWTKSGKEYIQELDDANQ